MEKRMNEDQLAEPTGQPVMVERPDAASAPSAIPPSANAVPAVSSSANAVPAVSSSVNAAPAASETSTTSHPTDSKAPAKHKLNHSYVWLGALRVLPAIIIATLASSAQLIIDMMLDSAEGGYGLVFIALCLVGIIVVTGIVMLVRFFIYRHIWYEYANDEFSFFSGIFSKKRVHVPYQRIQSIDQKASLFQRIFGVCTVSIETAGGAENKAIVLPYIEKAAAEALRKELFERKQIAQLKAAGIDVLEGTMPVGINAPTGDPVPGMAVPANLSGQMVSAVSGNALDVPARFANDFRGIFGGEVIDTGTVSYEYGLSNKELVLSAVTGKSSFSMVFFSVIAAIASVISSIGFVLGASEDEVFDTLSSLVSLIPSSWIVGAIASVVGFVLVSLLVVWLIMIASTCISYGGFRTRRRGARIETEYGIISHHFNGIDIERIQSIEISQSFFQRLLRSCTLSLARVASAAQDSSQESRVAKEKLVIHPFVKVDRVDEVLEGLLPEWSNLPVASKRMPQRALRRAITRRAILQGSGFWLAVSTFIVMFFLGLPVHMDAFTDADLMDYLTFYTVSDAIARVLYVVALLLVVCDVIGAILWRRGSGFGYDRAYVTITNSGFSTDRSIVPRVKVQLATLQTNPLQRNKHLVTIVALTAAGVGNSKIKLIDVEEEHAKEWFHWCHPGGNEI